MKQQRMTSRQYLQSGDEHRFQRSVITYIKTIAKPGVTAFAIPNAGKRSPRVAARLKAEGMLAGVADICVMMHNGRTGWLELKTVKGRQSPEQWAFEQTCVALGHSYEIARDLKDIVDILWEWEALT